MPYMRSPRFLPAALLAVLVSAAAGGMFGGSAAATLGVTRGARVTVTRE